MQLSRFDGKLFETPYDEQPEAEGFLFENTDPGGLGPESLQSFVDACLGRPTWKVSPDRLFLMCKLTGPLPICHC